MTKYYDTLDMPVQNADGSWTDLETGFVYGKRARRVARDRVPARAKPPKMLPADRAEVTRIMKALRSNQPAAFDELCMARMPVIVEVHSRLSGTRQDFVNKAAALSAVKALI